MAIKKVDKFLNNNESLPINITIDYTPEQAVEMQKCMDDVIYFAEHFFVIVHLDKGRQKIKLFDAQKKAIRSIIENKRTIICASRQIGKPLAIDTIIPTPDGYKTMGELKDGDFVLDWNGNPTKVTKAHPISNEINCYELSFSNGEKIIAGEEHEWYTKTCTDEGSVKTTIEIYNSLYDKKGNKNHIIPLKDKNTIVNYVTIDSVKKVEKVPVRCISVDNPEHMFLAGKKRIPTHNSTLMTIVCLWYVIFRKDFQVAILANKEDQAKEILERIKLAYEELPNWLKTGVSEFTKEVLKLVNGSKIFVSTTSESGIRGKSVNMLFVDEFAHIASQIAEPFFKSVMPTISSSKSAKIVLISTPKGATGKFYEIFRDAEKAITNNKKSGWSPVKIHYSEVPGRDENWKKEELSSINYDMETWRQEYEIEFLEDGTAALNQNVIDRMKSECSPAEFSFDDGIYLIWKEPEPNRIISIGVDVAEGVGQDYTIAIILDLTDLNHIEQCGIFACNKMQPWIFAEKLNQIARSWGRPFLCIERNKEGGQVIDALMNVHNYDNLVHYSMKNDKRNVYQSPGIFCHQNSKYTGIQNMKYFVENKQSVVLRDINTVREFETFVRKVNRTWGAKKGFNDDRIMALVWALILLEKDIAEKYLDVIEYDEAGKPLVVLDPNQNLSNSGITNLLAENKPIRDIGAGKEYNAFFNYYHSDKVSIPEKYQDMLENSSWEFI